MKIIRTDSAEFEGHFRRIRQRGRIFDPGLWAAVERIVEEVGWRGDEALFEYTARWDGHAVTAATVEASAVERKAAAAQVLPQDLEVLRLAAGRSSGKWCFSATPPIYRSSPAPTNGRKSPG